MTRRLLLLFPILLLSGCATFYEAKSSNPARVRFIADTVQFPTWVKAPALNCPGIDPAAGPDTFLISGARSGIRNLGMPAPPAGQRFLEARIDAGEIVFRGTHSYPVGPTPYEVSTCTAMLKVVLEPSKDYELRYQRQAQRCSLSIDELRTNNSGVVDRSPVSLAAPSRDCNR